MALDFLITKMTFIFLTTVFFFILVSLRRLLVFGDVGDGVGSDLGRSDQRLVLRRPRLGGRERALVDGEVGLDRAADQAAFQERVAAGRCQTQET